MVYSVPKCDLLKKSVLSWIHIPVVNAQQDWTENSFIFPNKDICCVTPVFYVSYVLSLTHLWKGVKSMLEGSSVSKMSCGLALSDVEIMLPDYFPWLLLCLSFTVICMLMRPNNPNPIPRNIFSKWWTYWQRDQWDQQYQCVQYTSTLSTPEAQKLIRALSSREVLRWCLQQNHTVINILPASLMTEPQALN